ncbi:MAG: GNAT family N-acetyltransferase [Proteobacteria bacterium]|nr:GNAT family N-acetyltransferase [Pseudomonadota bacterium]
MMKRCFILLKFFIVFLLFQSGVFAFNSFHDDDGEKISLRLRPKDASLSKEGKIFLHSFMENYKNVLPQDLKPAFQTPLDVCSWLKATFQDEKSLFKESPTVFCVRAKHIKRNILVGMMFFECCLNKDGAKIIHIRQLVVRPKSQRKGIGKKFLDFIKSLHPDFSEIIVDGRRVNTKACAFYRANGFKILENPHDKTLSPQEKYVGYSFKPSLSLDHQD